MGQIISADDLCKILEDHKKWISTYEEEGRRADLSGAEFVSWWSRSKLIGANLSDADLFRANLEGVSDLTIEQLSKVKTLYKAKLDPELMKQVKEKYHHLLEEPKKKAKGE